ncbi:MAG: LuxR C-terminal-related transcriptional regulator [Pseudomonadota bacterium]
MTDAPAALLTDRIAVSLSGELQEVLDAFSNLHGLVGEAGFYPRLADFFDKAIGYDAVSIFEFRRDLQPRVLFAQGIGTDGDLKKYLGGLYLLDPYFDLYENQGQTGFFRLQDDDQSDVDMSEAYKKYWQSLALSSEIGGLLELRPGHCLHLSFMFGERGADQLDRVGAFLEAVEKMTLTLCRSHQSAARDSDDSDQVDRRQIHAAVSSVLRNFGADLLTAREQEVAHQLLKGQSAKSIARHLDISPGTASIHRSNVYQKLGVMGQGDLFSLFLSELTKR